MSGEIRDWLTGLCDSDPSAAMAVGQALIALADARPGPGPPAVVALDPPPPHADPAAALDRELGHEAWPDGLMELRAGAPGGDVRVIFAIEPAGVALLISVLEGRDAILDQHRQAVAVSAEILRRVRSGQDREASAVEFAGSRQFADEFFPAAPTTPAGTGDASQARPLPGDVDVPPAAAGTGAMAPLTIPWLPFPLAREGRPPCEYRVRDAALVLTGAASTDLFVDPAGAGTAPDAGRLLGTPPPGDFTLAALVRGDFRATYDAGVLLLYAGERRWAKLCLELSPQRQPTAVTVVTRDTSDDCNSFEVTDRSLWLRITRAGAAWAFHASTDGDWWRLLRYFSLGSDEPVRVGFLAQSPTGQGCTATFEQIALRAGAPSDLRDGS